MATSAEIDARKAAIAAVKNGHNTFAGAFNTGAQALTPLAADFQPLIIALNAAAVAHNNSVPLITAAEAFWNAAVPSDPIIIPPAGAVNVALSSNGGVATASTTHPGYTAGAVNNGDRTGPLDWNDSTQNVLPDWVQVTFPTQQNIVEVDVFTFQDDPTNPVTPTPTMTFSTYGITDFQVQYWNGSSWLDVPGGNITGNNLVWRRLTFPAISTSAIRVLVNAALAGFSRVVELEAWNDGTAPPPTKPVPTIDVFTVNKQTANPGEQVTVTWATTGADPGGVTLYVNGVPEVVAASGSKTVTV